jgi:iron(III) transport system substrate-binding protein
MKRLFALLLLFIFVVAGCSPKDAEPDNLFGDWLTTANLDAEETSEQLYAAALLEDMLIVYSTSTRMYDVAKSFEAHYPGLIVHVEHLREFDLYDRLKENYDNRNFNADLICSTDGRGIMASELMPKGIVIKYVPYDIADKMLPGNNDAYLMLAGEAPMLQYNDEYYDTPPVSNWWELTEERWRGKVYMPNPTRSVTTLAFLAMIVKDSDMMVQAYEDLYGIPLALNSGENAGEVFIQRLVANEVIIVNSSEEATEAVGFPGSRSPAVGIIASSKIRARDLGYEITIQYDMEPFAGMYAPINIMMAGGAKNVNAAKLFIRWLLGEANGQGEGYEPYLQSGAWSVRSDVRDDSGIRSEELNLLRMDAVYMYENYDKFLEFWESLYR